MYETKIAAAARVEAKLYADVVNNIENKNNVCKTAVIITKIVIGNVFNPASRNRRNASAVNRIRLHS